MRVWNSPWFWLLMTAINIVGIFVANASGDFWWGVICGAATVGSLHEFLDAAKKGGG